MKKYQAKIYRVKIMLKLLMMIYHDHAKKSSTIFDRFNALSLYHFNTLSLYPSKVKTLIKL
jgi:hypothetical protein